MNSTIQQLYLGELRPDLQTPHSDEYSDCRIAFQKSRDALTDLFPDLEPKITELLDNYGLMTIIERREMFEYGFSLGIRLVLDALSVSNT